MAVPQDLQPVPMDGAAAAEAQRQLASAERLLVSIATQRRRRRAAATQQWTGWHRDLNDESDDAVDRGVQEVVDLLHETRRRIASEVDDIREVNRHRARARALFEEREAARRDEVLAEVRPGWQVR